MQWVGDLIGKTGMFGPTWATFGLAAIVVYLISLRSMKAKGSLRALLGYAFPFKKWTSKSSRTDVVMYLGSKIINGFMLTFGAVISTFIAVWLSGIIAGYLALPSLGHPSILLLIVMSVVLFVVVDFANYVTH